MLYSPCTDISLDSALIGAKILTVFWDAVSAVL